jgi:hypothetical protein
MTAKQNQNRSKLIPAQILGSNAAAYKIYDMYSQSKSIIERANKALGRIKTPILKTSNTSNVKLDSNVFKSSQNSTKSIKI